MKIGCLSICELVDASCAMPGLRERQEVEATFNFSPVWKVSTVCHLKLESSSMPRVKGQVGCQILRSFLRLAVSRFLALVRPQDYGSLTGGMVDDPLWRHALYSLMHRQSGPSLLCAGQWSKMGLLVALLAEDGICPRCKEAPENLMHRLWYCRAIDQYRVQLNSLVPAAVSFPESLLHTLARTGIPAGRLGRALRGRVRMSLELLVVLCCWRYYGPGKRIQGDA